MDKARELVRGMRYEVPTAECLIPRLWPGASVVRHQAHSHIDFAIIGADGRFLAQLEVKRRFLKHDAYPTTMVAWEKHDAARFFRKFFNAPTICVVVFNDKAGYFQLETAPVGKERKHRYDRPEEERLYALYALDAFTWVDGLAAEIEAAVQRSDGVKYAELGEIPTI